jgi:hypothetical protein
MFSHHTWAEQPVRLTLCKGLHCLILHFDLLFLARTPRSELLSCRRIAATSPGLRCRDDNERAEGQLTAVPCRRDRVWVDIWNVNPVSFPRKRRVRGRGLAMFVRLDLVLPSSRPLLPLSRLMIAG